MSNEKELSGMKFKFGDIVEFCEAAQPESVIDEVFLVQGYAGEDAVVGLVRVVGKKFSYIFHESRLQKVAREGDLIAEILEWFNVAVPKPTLENQMMQWGCHCEEIKEMFHAVKLYGEESGVHETRFKIKFKPYFDKLAGLSKKERIDVLDALCDQIVTACGVGYMMGMDIRGALAEVSRSNNSKFEKGRPVFNEAGKIVKGKDYCKPDLEKFV